MLRVALLSTDSSAPDCVEGDSSVLIARLREVLHAHSADPALRTERLCLRRELSRSTAGAGDDLDAELRWLLRRGSQVGANPQQMAAARRSLAALRARNAETAPDDDIDALFEAADASASLASEGDPEAAARVGAERDRRALLVVDVEAVRREADERWAAHQFTQYGADPETDARELDDQAALLESIATRFLDRGLRRRVRRARAAASDLRLQARLERLLTRRGAAAVDSISFWLLFVVIGSLVAQSSSMGEQALEWANALDAAAGCWFVGEFALKLSLSDRRGSWFLRNALTDLLPAIPAVLLLLPIPVATTHAGDAIAIRLLRLFRMGAAASGLQILRPTLRFARLLLLLVRGMDASVRRFRGVLDQTIVFLGAADPERGEPDAKQELLAKALALERVELESMPGAAGIAAAGEALADAIQRADAFRGAWTGVATMPPSREVAVDDACDFLWSLRAEDVARSLSSSEIRSLDRMLRLISAPPLRWLPLLSSFCLRGWHRTAEERVAALGRRIADWLMLWQDRLQFFADLHGIVTGPQILDRIATAMVKASQRPAVRLLFFGGLFSVLSLFWEENCLSTIVGMPLLLLGSVCLVFLVTGWWLKRIAGEASETFRLTSEAHFVALLGLQKQRHEAEDAAFLARRTIEDCAPIRTSELLSGQIRGARAGVPVDLHDFDAAQEQLASRVALLYLHFLGGALLHDSDVKTTEQILANLSLENLRLLHLGHTRKDRKRLRALRLDDGSVFRGPYLWFRFITESIAVEVSKRLLEYNRRCVPLSQRASLSPERERLLADWLRSRKDQRHGRTIERFSAEVGSAGLATTEFHALHFLAAEPERDAHVERTFGPDVLAALRSDRRHMIRTIFGMRAAENVDGVLQTLNPWRSYWSRWSHGRVLLAPLAVPLRVLRGVFWSVVRVRQIVREVVAPRLEMERRTAPVATFAVAMRKIHRMKAPGLLEATRLRVCVDPTYCGASPSFVGVAEQAASQLERDLDFLRVHERERATLLAAADTNRRHVLQLREALRWLPRVGDLGAASEVRRDGELAVTIAWMTDRDRVRTLFDAAAWSASELPTLLRDGELPGLLRATWWRLRGRWHPDAVDRWCASRVSPLSPAARSRLRLACMRDSEVRRRVEAMHEAGEERDLLALVAQRLDSCWRQGHELRNELVSLRAIQSLAVLDVRNYRALVFELGDYAADGVERSEAFSLP